MGKIVAVGGGRYDGEIDSIAESIIKFSGKEAPKIVFLPTAGHDDVNGDEVIEVMFRKFGALSFDTLFLTDERLSPDYIRSTILGADIIYAGGGNLEFLMDVWTRTRADAYLKEAYEKGIVLSGYSSGAMCWFDRGFDDCGPEGSFMFVDCLGILPFCNCPHFESDHWQAFVQAVKEQPLSGVAIEDGAALFFEDGEYYCVRGNDGGEVWYLNCADGYKMTNVFDEPNVIKKDVNYKL